MQITDKCTCLPVEITDYNFFFHSEAQNCYDELILMSNLLPGQPVAIERKRLLGLVLRDSVSSSLKRRHMLLTSSNSTASKANHKRK